MKNRTTVLLGLLTLAGSVAAQMNPLLVAIVGQQDDGKPRLIKGTMTNVTFGNVGSVTINSGTDPITYVVTDQTKFNVNSGSQSLTALYQTSYNKEIYAVIQRTDNQQRVKEVWDMSKWAPYLQSHRTSIMGTVKSFSPKLLQLGTYNFMILSTTKYVLNGQPSTRAKLMDKPQLWVKGDYQSNMPIAVTIADTSAGLGVETGGNTRPPSTGSTRPPSTGGAPAGSNSTGSSPTERGNQTTRPPSTGTPSVSPTERSAQVRRGFVVNIYFKITDSSDMSEKVVNEAGGAVVKGVAGAVGAEDTTLEVFGELKFNGKPWWKLDRKKPRKAEDNARIDVNPRAGTAYASGSGFLIKAESLKLTGSILDDDGLSKSDVIYQVNQTVNLFDAAGKGWIKYTVNGAKAELYISVVAK